ncbi:OST-HTH/LOTUS domain-containing protein [Phthorimaea operculella]|nr:OST-HTH/LOTUS domain-containing protein [Phthorimaea operculella]
MWSGSEGPLATCVLRSEWDARLCIARVHKRRLDNHWAGRRLELSLGRPSPAPNLDVLRARLRAILLEAQGHHLPLLRLRDAYASRHCTALTTSDLNKLKDTVIIHDGFGRMVQLVDLTPVSSAEMEEAPWKCHVHAGLNTGHEDGSRILQPVFMEIAGLTRNVQLLLENHGGILPLLSFVECYEATFPPLVADPRRGVALELLLRSVPGVECYEATFPPLVADPRRGVALELLLRSVPGVEVKDSPSRHLAWRTERAETPPQHSHLSESSRSSNERERPRTAPALEPMLALFERELIDLLKSAPRCCIPFSKLIPAFHHHFGRQCRVADYGFTKLPDLLQALGNTIGEIQDYTETIEPMLALFERELIDLLKSAPRCCIPFSKLIPAFHHHFGRQCRVADYGFTKLPDLLQALGNTIGEIQDYTETIEPMLALFERELIDLLKSAPRCCIPFSKLIPAFHHHFGRQCRVADYGFTKLPDLLQALGNTIGENYIVETVFLSKLIPAFHHHFGRQCRVADYGFTKLPDLLQALGNTIGEIQQTVQYVRQCRVTYYGFTKLPDLLQALGNTIGEIQQSNRSDRQCRVADYGFTKLPDLLQALGNTIGEIQDYTETLEPMLALFERELIDLLKSAPRCCIPFSKLIPAFHHHFGRQCRVADYGFTKLPDLLQALGNTIGEIQDYTETIEPMLALFERELIDLLKSAPRCCIPFSKLIPAFHHHFGRQCRVADYGFTKLPDLLQALGNTIDYIPFSKLIPAFHHHFGRQCRVADYGFTKLPDLLQALGNTIVVLGSGSSRVITISGAAQARRWTSDLVKLLKAQPGRSIMPHDIPQLYQATFGKPFSVVEYGVCTLQELMSLVFRHAGVCTGAGVAGVCGRGGARRGRRAVAAAQAVELLCYTPNLRMEFSRFVPAYHAHFGRQLRVAHYGCVKLVELFELIPEAVTVGCEVSGERSVRLASKAAKAVIGQRLQTLGPVPLSALPSQYAAQFGAPPQPEVLDVTSLEAMVYASGGCVEEGIVKPPGDSARWASAALAACAVLAADRSVARGSTQEYFESAFRRLRGSDPETRNMEAAGIIEICDRRVQLTNAWRVVWRLATLLADRTPRALDTLLHEYITRYEHNFNNDIGIIEICDRRVQLTNAWRVVWRLATLLADRTPRALDTLLHEYITRYEHNFNNDIGIIEICDRRVQLTNAWRVIWRLATLLADRTPRALDTLLHEYITRYEHNFNNDIGVDGIAELLRGTPGIFYNVGLCWALHPAVTPPRPLRPPPQEDYSVHDTPPGQKGSRVFDSPKVNNIWCSPPASALPAPTALLPLENKRKCLVLSGVLVFDSPKVSNIWCSPPASALPAPTALLPLENKRVLVFDSPKVSNIWCSPPASALPAPTALLPLENKRVLVFDSPKVSNIWCSPPASALPAPTALLPLENKRKCLLLSGVLVFDSPKVSNIWCSPPASALPAPTALLPLESKRRSFYYKPLSKFQGLQSAK